MPDLAPHEIEWTREQWIAAAERARKAGFSPMDHEFAAELILGPCPPEPCPEIPHAALAVVRNVPLRAENWTAKTIDGLLNLFEDDWQQLVARREWQISHPNPLQGSGSDA